MSGIIPGCYTHPWLLYASLVVIRIQRLLDASMTVITHPRSGNTHPWLLNASLVVIRLPDRYTHPYASRYTHPWLLYASLGVIPWLLYASLGCYTPP